MGSAYFDYFAHHARELYQSTAFLQGGSADEAQARRDALARDLTRVVLACAGADAELSASEKLAFTLLVIPALRGDPDASAVEDWDDQPKQLRTDIMAGIDAVLAEVEASGERTLELPAQLRQWDAANGTAHFAAYAAAVYRFASVLIKADGTVNAREEACLRSVWESLHRDTPVPARAIAPPVVSTTPLGGASASGTAAATQRQQAAAAPGGPGAVSGADGTLAALLAELDELVGLQAIKESVRSFTNYLQVQRERERRGLGTTAVSLHSVFTGPPGTGKTTVARLLARIYQQLGFLSRGHLVETDRAGLVAGFVGQTAIKVDQVVSSALDGVLFIDEAYALSRGAGGSNDYGAEAIETLLKRMEDSRDRLVVIVAGYGDEMETFLDSNPGLRSRFTRQYAFDHYSPEELVEIFARFCQKAGYRLDPAARAAAAEQLTARWSARGKSFGNAREARNLFERAAERQANRIAGIAPLSDEILATLRAEDITFG